MSIYDEVQDELNNAVDFDGLYDEAYTKLVEDIKAAARLGRKEFIWHTGDYPSVINTIDDRRLANWLMRDGFSHIASTKSRPEKWMVLLTNEHEDE